jgi:hypothetical protein
MGPNGGRLKDELINNGILEVESLTTLRIKRTFTLDPENIKKITGKDFEKVCAILNEGHNGKIFFSEALYGILWATINWLYTSYEKIYVEYINANARGVEFTITPEIDNLLRRSYDLFNWAQRLRTEYSEWPNDIFPIEDKDPWTGKVSNIWVSAIGFLFYHEYSHAMGNSVEKLADSYAFKNLCLLPTKSEDKKCNILGAIGVIIATFFLLDKPEAIVQGGEHLDLDVRLENLINSIDGELDEIDLQYIKLFCSYSLALFLKSVRVSRDFRSMGNNAYEIWENMLLFCKELKSNKNSQLNIGLQELNIRAEDILGEGILVFRRLNEEIELKGKTLGQDIAYTDIPRMMLKDSLTLATEVIYSLKDERLLISLIGLRSLFETLINIAYIYAHPEHKNDLPWSTGLCKDCIRRANDPDAFKNQLGDVSVAKRAKEVGLEAHYKDIIGGLSNFTHMIGFCPTQNDPQKTEKMYRSAYVQVLTAMLDIYQVLQNHFNLQKADVWKSRVVTFSKEYAVNMNGR